MLRRYPRRLPQFLISAVTGHHFIRYTSEVMEREEPLPVRKAGEKAELMLRQEKG